MIKDNEQGLLYDCKDACMLATKVSQIFDSDSLANKLSMNASNIAIQRHSPIILENCMIDIYKDIILKDKENQRNRN